MIDVAKGRPISGFRNFWSIARFCLIALAIDAGSKAAFSQGQNTDPAVDYRLQVQIGHQHNIDKVLFAPDGRVLISQGGATIKRWDLRTGRLIDSSGGMRFGLSAGMGEFILSPDGQRVAAVVTKNDTIALAVLSFVNQSVASQEMLLSNDKWSKWAAVSFHPKNADVVILTSPSGLVQFDTRTGKISSTLSPTYGGTAAATPDGTRIAYGTARGISIWDVVNEKLVTTIKPLLIPLRPESKEAKPWGMGLSTMALSDDGSILAVHILSDQNLHLWALPEGRELAPLSVGGARTTPIAISADNSTLAASGDGSINLYDLRTRSAMRTINVAENRLSSLSTLQFSRDGAQLAYGLRYGENDKSIGIANVAEARVETHLIGIQGSAGEIDVAESARKIIYGNADSRPIWDLNALALASSHLSLKAGSYCAISSDGTRAFVDGSVWELNPPRMILPASALFGEAGSHVINQARFMDGGKSLFVASKSTGMKLIDIGSARVKWDVPGYDGTEPVAFSPDDALVTIGADIWNVGAKEKNADISLPAHGSDREMCPGIVNSNKAIVVLSTRPTGSAIRFEVTMSDGSGTLTGEGNSDGYSLHTFSATNGSRQGWVNIPSDTEYSSAAFDPSGRMAWLGTRMGTVRELDVATGKLLHEWQVAPGEVRHLRFLPDMHCLVMANEEDPVVTLLEVSTGHTLNLLSSGDEWIVYTEDGYFDCSPGGAKYLNVVSGTSAFGIDQFATRLNRPDIILERFGLGSKLQIDYFRRQHEKRLKKLGLKEDGGSFAHHVPSVQITSISNTGSRASLVFTASDDLVPLLSYQIFVNGVPLSGGKGKALDGRKVISESIELSAGLNRVEVSCMNEAGAESIREMVELTGEASSSPELYFLGIGVSKYKDASLNLGFADKDAQDLAALFSRMGSTYAKINVRSLVNETATQAAFTEVSHWLSQSKVNDTVVVFIAGHGVHDRDPDATYYFLTHEADPAHLAGTSVSYEAIEALMAGVPARRKLLLIDTCESGELDEGMFASYVGTATSRGLRGRAVPRAPAESRGMAAVAAPAQALRPYLLDRNRLIMSDLSRRSGAVIFSACLGNELSYESDSYRNGYFTAGILRTLRGEEGAANSGTIDTFQLRQAVKAWVEKETGDLQHPTVDRDNVYQVIGFAVVRN
ncbi:MAG: caspase family protein [Verrucomicrobiota bacterium]